MPAPGDLAAISAYASRRVMVLPAQGLRPDDAMGWVTVAGDARAMLAQVDSALDQGIRLVKLSPGWIRLPEALRTAQRNPVYIPPPGDIQAADAVRALERKPDENIAEPVASQLRTYAGFNDARYALVPMELRFERGEFADAGRAVLEIGLLDIRASKLAWLGEVAGFDAGDPPTAIRNLGRRLADLIAPR